MLTLYLSPGSSSMAPHIAMHEIGVAFEPKLLSFARHEQHSPEYLAVNPDGKVPTLLVDGRPMTEVAAILYYLARTYPQAGLWPEASIETEAQVISWMSFIAATVHPARRAGRERWDAVFELTEKKIGAGDWLVDRYSIADIHLFRLYWRYTTTVEPSSGTFPRLEAHYRRMMARPAVQRAIEIEREIGYQLPQ